MKTLIGAAVLSLITAAPAWGLRPGIEAGLNLASYHREFDSGIETSDFRAGASAGVTLELGAAPVGFATGLRWVSYPEREDVDLPWTVGEVATVTHWLAMPLRVRYGAGATGLYLSGGLEPAWLVAARRDAEVTILEDASPRTAPPAALIFEEVDLFATDVTSEFHRWNVSATLGAGIAWPALGRVWHVESRWLQGLGEVDRVGGMDMRIRAFELVVGVR